MLEKLKKSLEESPVIKKGDYDYFVNPITDGIPVMYPEILTEIVDVVKEKINLNEIDKIVAIEAMGIHLATALSIETGIPFVVIRKREYGLPNEHAVFQETGYSKNNLYINYLSSQERVLIIDDVVSTGGTLTAVVNALKDIKVDIKSLIAIVEKNDGKKIVKKETGIDVITFARLDIIEGKPIVEIL